ISSSMRRRAGSLVFTISARYRAAAPSYRNFFRGVLSAMGGRHKAEEKNLRERLVQRIRCVRPAERKHQKNRHARKDAESKRAAAGFWRRPYQILGILSRGGRGALRKIGRLAHLRRPGQAGNLIANLKPALLEPGKDQIVMRAGLGKRIDRRIQIVMLDAERGNPGV